MVEGPLGVELNDLKRSNTAIAFSNAGVPGTHAAKAFLQKSGNRSFVVAAPIARDAREHTKGRVISERDGRPQDNDVVLVLGPTLKLLSKVLANRTAALVIGEWPDTPLRWLGRLTGALDVTSGERLSPAVDAGMLELLKDLDWAGNNGWSDRPGKRDAVRLLAKMQDRDDFEPELVTSYMLLNSHSTTSIERLRKMMQE